MATYLLNKLLRETAMSTKDTKQDTELPITVHAALLGASLAADPFYLAHPIPESCAITRPRHGFTMFFVSRVVSEKSKAVKIDIANGLSSAKSFLSS